ncbi:MAG: SDR family NAD(P)-dependent oxidoreductase, partial [Nevskia sp.]|nr:SDR family NAD(P)-dependent oxidoreductase [Nevskia sp.]
MSTGKKPRTSRAKDGAATAPEAAGIPFDHVARNRRRLALITGGNRGLGLESARQLAQAGVDVLLGSRDLEKGTAALTQLGRLPGTV